MSERAFSEGDVEAVLASPVRGTYVPAARDRAEHYGYAGDGRLLNVVTNRARTVVITVVEQ
ncbi:MAG: hypothetical protein QOI11_1754 [Candidatus Eremiobacteraeota bacterium]|jgi:hypothetical protein|nr:hypothetical protein [Candidatus Eremiobacteraeota bacterium]